MKKLLPFTIIFLCALISCNTQLRVEKRHYTKGFYVAVNESSKARKTTSQRDHSQYHPKPTVTESAFYNQNNNDSANVESIIGINIDQTPEILTSSINKAHNNPTKSAFVGAPDSRDFVKKSRILPFRLPFIKQNGIKNKQSDGEINGGALASLIIGIVFLCSGTVILWFVSIIFGACLIVAGLISLIVGAVRLKKKKYRDRDTEPAPNVLVDIVYLNNGSIIRGNIIEQKINEYVKIQTKDGSIFVYNLTDILKITKEK